MWKRWALFTDLETQVHNYNNTTFYLLEQTVSIRKLWGHALLTSTWEAGGRDFKNEASGMGVKTSGAGGGEWRGNTH